MEFLSGGRGVILTRQQWLGMHAPDFWASAGHDRNRHGLFVQRI